jgi:hypothetical protein
MNILAENQSSLLSATAKLPGLHDPAVQPEHMPYLFCGFTVPGSEPLFKLRTRLVPLYASGRVSNGGQKEESFGVNFIPWSNQEEQSAVRENLFQGLWLAKHTTFDRTVAHTVECQILKAEDGLGKFLLRTNAPPPAGVGPVTESFLNRLHSGVAFMTAQEHITGHGKQERFYRYLQEHVNTTKARDDGNSVTLTLTSLKPDLEMQYDKLRKSRFSGSVMGTSTDITLSLGHTDLIVGCKLDIELNIIRAVTVYEKGEIGYWGKYQRDEQVWNSGLTEFLNSPNLTPLVKNWSEEQISERLDMHSGSLAALVGSGGTWFAAASYPKLSGMDLSDTALFISRYPVIAEALLTFYQNVTKRSLADFIAYAPIASGSGFTTNEDPYLSPSYIGVEFRGGVMKLQAYRLAISSFFFASKYHGPLPSSHISPTYAVSSTITRNIRVNEAVPVTPAALKCFAFAKNVRGESLVMQAVVEVLNLTNHKMRIGSFFRDLQRRFYYSPRVASAITKAFQVTCAGGIQILSFTVDGARWTLVEYHTRRSSIFSTQPMSHHMDFISLNSRVMWHSSAKYIRALNAR